MFNDHHRTMQRRKKLFFIPVIFALFFGLSWAVQYLWNFVLPDVTHVSPLNYWQAAALLVLCRILFGGFGFKGRGGGRPGWGGGPTPEMREKWMSMSDEERALFKQKFKDRCRNRG